jgi:hypothetical protein
VTRAFQNGRGGSLRFAREPARYRAHALGEGMGCCARRGPE